MKMASSLGMVEDNPAPGPSLALRDDMAGRQGAIHSNLSCQFATGAPSDESGSALVALSWRQWPGMGSRPVSGTGQALRGNDGDRVLPFVFMVITIGWTDSD